MLDCFSAVRTEIPVLKFIRLLQNDIQSDFNVNRFDGGCQEGDDGISVLFLCKQT